MESTGRASSAPMPHVVMIPFPLQGHITPLIQLSKLLAARGFAITFVSSQFTVKSMMKVKQGLMAADLSKLGVRLVGIPDGFPDTQEHTQATIQSSLPALHTSFDELVGTMVQEQKMDITCIISDSYLVWTQDVANKWHIPRVSFWPLSLSAFACSICLPEIMAAFPSVDFFKDLAAYRSEAPQALNFIPGLSDMTTRHLPFFSLNELGATWNRAQLLAQMERVNESLCLICNSSPAVETEAHTHLKQLPLSTPLFSLGPLLPGGQESGSSMYEEDEECMHWLDTQRPKSVLYISLGSVVSARETDLLEIAMGLKACKVPFLWVVRSTPCEASLSSQESLGKVVRWAPQLRVLSHQAIGGFLTHCGWNAPLESITMGVPIIGWPFMMDHITICWIQVDKLKVGIRLELDESNKVERTRVEKAVRMLMQEEEGLHMRERVSHLSSLVKSSLNTSFPSTLDSFIQTIQGKHQQAI